MANKEFEKGVEREIMKVLLQLGYKIEAECKIRTPVVTGQTRAAWSVEQKKNSVVVGNSVNWINALEFLYDMPERDMWEAKRKRGGQLETKLPIIRPILLNAEKYLQEICSRK